MGRMASADWDTVLHTHVDEIRALSTSDSRQSHCLEPITAPAAAPPNPPITAPGVPAIAAPARAPVPPPMTAPLAVRTAGVEPQPASINETNEIARMRVNGLSTNTPLGEIPRIRLKYAFRGKRSVMGNGSQRDSSIDPVCREREPLPGVRPHRTNFPGHPDRGLGAGFR